jgi:pimeloyl-ACP methyl ester carboxylesterase
VLTKILAASLLALTACAPAPVSTPAPVTAPAPEMPVPPGAEAETPRKKLKVAKKQPRPDAGAGEAFDPEATDYAYPHPVHFFEAESQREPVKMAYLDVAPSAARNGRTVVLLHGKNFGAFAWGQTIASLTRAGFRVIAPDQVGFGKSSKPPGYQYSFTQLAANTRALLASLGIAKSVVVGHSMGGMLGTRYALAYPEATEKLLLVNPIGLEDYGALIAPRTVDQWYADELKQTPESIRAYQQKAYYDGAWKPEYEELTRLAAGWTRHPGYRDVAWASARTYDMIVTQPVVHDFPRLRVPTRLVIGTRDRTAPGRNFAPPEIAKGMGDYAKLGKATQKAIPGAELVELPGLGHCPQVERFAEWEKALLAFVR